MSERVRPGQNGYHPAVDAGWEIRRLGPEDAEAWFALRVASLEEHPRAFLESAEEARSHGVALARERLAVDPRASQTLGAFVDSSLVGLVGVHRTPRQKARHHAVVWGVYAAPSHRRSGLGGALIDAAIEAARAMGVERLGLSVDAENELARRLYLSRGFASWGVEQDAFRVDGEPVNEEHMVLSLDG